MKRLNEGWADCLCGFALIWGLCARAASWPNDWQHEQQFEAPATGLFKLNLPVETLDEFVH